MKTVDVEIWVMVDSDGDYVVSADADELAERYEESVQPLADAGGLRRVKVTLTVPLPVVSELTGVVSDQGVAVLREVVSALAAPPLAGPQRRLCRWCGWVGHSRMRPSAGGVDGSEVDVRVIRQRGPGDQGRIEGRVR